MLSLSVAALLEKMRDAAQHARSRAGSDQKSLIKKFYSDKGIRRRVQLLFHPDVVKALTTIWLAADTDGSQFIEKDEYLVMHRLVLALIPALPAVRLQGRRGGLGEGPEGKTGSTRTVSLVLVRARGLWTDSVSPRAYVTFTVRLPHLPSRSSILLCA